MSPVSAATAGLVSYLVFERVRPQHRWRAAICAGGLVVAPVLCLVVAGGATTVMQARLWIARRRIKRAADADVGLMARTVLISVTAGMSLPAALELAASHVHPHLGMEITALLGQARRTGLANALAQGEGRAARLYLLLARAQTTGASVTGAVAAFVDEQRQKDRAHTLEGVRRLPVKLTIPLALLILPGFVVLTVGPSVLTTARRLLGPLVSLP